MGYKKSIASPAAGGGSVQAHFYPGFPHRSFTNTFFLATRQVVDCFFHFGTMDKMLCGSL
jgi:hypothetical protein